MGPGNTQPPVHLLPKIGPLHVQANTKTRSRRVTEISGYVLAGVDRLLLAFNFLSFLDLLVCLPLLLLLHLLKILLVFQPSTPRPGPHFPAIGQWRR